MIDQIRADLEKIKYLDWRFEVNQYGPWYHLKTVVPVKDSDNPELDVSVDCVVPFAPGFDYSDKWLAALVFKMIVEFYAHEAGEWFTFNDEKTYHPHMFTHPETKFSPVYGSGLPRY